MRPNSKFIDFINNLENIANKSKKPWEKYGAYNLKRYICDSDENILVDHVFKLEDIDIKFKDKMAELGIEIKNIKHLNKVNSKGEYTKLKIVI